MSKLAPQPGSPWTPTEDVLLLRHVSEYGTKRWGSLQSSGALPHRDQKACCNRFILLKKKFLLARGAAQQPRRTGHGNSLCPVTGLEKQLEPPIASLGPASDSEAGPPQAFPEPLMAGESSPHAFAPAATAMTSWRNSSQSFGSSAENSCSPGMQPKREGEEEAPLVHSRAHSLKLSSLSGPRFKKTHSKSSCAFPGLLGTLGLVTAVAPTLEVTEGSEGTENLSARLDDISGQVKLGVDSGHETFSISSTRGGNECHLGWRGMLLERSEWCLGAADRTRSSFVPKLMETTGLGGQSQPDHVEFQQRTSGATTGLTRSPMALPRNQAMPLLRVSQGGTQEVPSGKSLTSAYFHDVLNQAQGSSTEGENFWQPRPSTGLGCNSCSVLKPLSSAGHRWQTLPPDALLDEIAATPLDMLL